MTLRHFRGLDEIAAMRHVVEREHYYKNGRIIVIDGQAVLDPPPRLSAAATEARMQTYFDNEITVLDVQASIEESKRALKKQTSDLEEKLAEEKHKRKALSLWQRMQLWLNGPFP